jgi:hypothetical protein
MPKLNVPARARDWAMALLGSRFGAGNRTGWCRMVREMNELAGLWRRGVGGRKRSARPGKIR